MRKVRTVFTSRVIGVDLRIHIPITFVDKVNEIVGWNKRKVAKFYKVEREVESNWEIYQIQKRK